jgi:GDP-L-fucose synthase
MKGMGLKICITGGSGMLGKALTKNIKNFWPGATVYSLSSKDVNLTDSVATNTLFSFMKPDVIFHLAAKVGGVSANTQYVSDFCEENIKINSNVLNAAKNVNAQCISALSTCIYPDKAHVVYPLTEEQLHNGPPHESNFGYAYAKRMLEVQSKAYNKQYGTKFSCVILNNLYGLEDNFDVQNAHVIPALINKIYLAKFSNFDFISVWGSGKAIREFTYANDVALILMELYLHNKNAVFETMNIGSTESVSIAKLAEMIKENLGYKGRLVFGIAGPEGQLEKPSSNLKFLTTNIWKKENYTKLQDGLKKTCEWFEKTYEENPSSIRGASMYPNLLQNPWSIMPNSVQIVSG